MAELAASFTDPKHELLRLAKEKGNDTCADCGKKGGWIVLLSHLRLASRRPLPYAEAVRI